MSPRILSLTATLLFASRLVAQTPAAPDALPQTNPVERSRRQARTDIDAATRSLLVTTDDATNEQIRTILQSLDQPTPQALIRVLFLEVTHNDSLDLGIDATNKHQDKRGHGSVLSSLYGVAAETQGGIVTLVQNNFNATLVALSKVGKLNVLSRPSVLVRNNEQATILVGQSVPFITDSRITDTGQTINTVQYQDIGISLTVTPDIGDNGRIELNVNPQITAISSQTVPISDTINAPVIDKRSATTEVVVPSGKTVVIGGLIQDQDTVTISKIPILGDIPLLGALFRHKVTTKDKTELLIFLTPTVVVGTDELGEVSTGATNELELIPQENSPEKLNRYLKIEKGGK